MSFFKDEYLIEYLLQNGYSEEELMSDTFNWSSLQRNFEMPIDLDKVTNVSEMGNFILANTQILVGKEAIESGKVEQVTQIMIDCNLKAKESGLKLDKVYVECGQVFYKKDEEKGVSFDKTMFLDGFDLSETEFIYDTTQGLTKVGESEEKKYFQPVYWENSHNNKDNRGAAVAIERDIKQFPAFNLSNCSNLDIGKLHKNSFTLNNCSDFAMNQVNDYYFFTINGYTGNTDFIKLIKTDMLNISGLDEFDLATIDFDADTWVNLSDIEKCYLSEDKHFECKVKFNNVNFENGFDKKAEFDKELFFTNCSIDSDITMFVANKDFNLSDSELGVLNSVEAKDDIYLSNMDVDFEMEYQKEKYGKKLKYKDNVKGKDGFDVRRLEKEVDLSDKDILENPELLEAILRDNKFLEIIKVSPNLSETHKAILARLAPNKYYSYDFDNDIVIYDDKDKKGQVNFEKFSEADKIYNKIVEGLNPDWSDLEKYKYLYNQLGMLISYDVNVLSGNDDLESHDAANLVARNPFTSVLTSKGVCAGIAESYQYLCQKAELECSMEGSDNHRYNIITYENENSDKVISYCDLTWDLLDVKRENPCKYFAKSSEEFAKDHPNIELDNAVGITKEEQKEIDSAIGYIENDYTIQKYIEMIEPYKELNNNHDKINILLQKMMELGRLENMSNREVVTFARDVLVNADVSKCGVVNVFATKQSKYDKDTRGILWVEDEERSTEDKKEYLYYVFNSEQQAFKSADYELIEELLANGMLEFYADTKLPGFENWGSEKENQEKLNNRAQAAAQDR